jgi:ATP-dependent protease HslVU (ClpYQ) peptidase subunit
MNLIKDKRGNYMARLTRALKNNEFYVEEDKVIHGVDGYTGDAINKLAVFENIYDDLISNQNEISKELEKLRNEDKTRTAKFRDLMARRLTNSYTISLFKAYEL